jgi:hypothetical protein
MRRDLEAPGESKKEVKYNYKIVQFLCFKVTMISKAQRVFRVVVSRGKQSKVPVLGHVPVERIQGVYKNKEHPMIVRRRS